MTSIDWVLISNLCRTRLSVNSSLEHRAKLCTRDFTTGEPVVTWRYDPH